MYCIIYVQWIETKQYFFLHLLFCDVQNSAVVEFFLKCQYRKSVNGYM